MGTIAEIVRLESQGTLPAREVGRFLEQLIELSGVTEKALAQAVAMSESQLNRMLSKRTGLVKAQTIQPLKRIAVLVEEARQTLAGAGAKAWLTTPNPYLDDVPPIQHLRSEKELEKALDLLASIRHGFPA
jgi:putative toxin-antitoxin system antitoxin component (TIGR02293 family)